MVGRNRNRGNGELLKLSFLNFYCIIFAEIKGFTFKNWMKRIVNMANCVLANLFKTTNFSLGEYNKINKQHTVLSDTCSTGGAKKMNIFWDVIYVLLF